MEKQGKKPRKKPILTALKAMRLASGLSLDDMVDKGFYKTTYSHIEGGRYRTSPNIRIQLSDIFEVRPHFLFDRYGYPARLSKKDIIAMMMVKRRRGDYV